MSNKTIPNLLNFASAIGTATGITPVVSGTFSAVSALYAMFNDEEVRVETGKPIIRPSASDFQLHLENGTPIAEILESEEQLLSLSSPPKSYEDISALFGYGHLWRQYPRLHDKWIPPINGFPIKAPFIEVIAFRMDKELEIRFKRSNKSYELPNYVTQYIDLFGKKPRDNEDKLRIDSIEIEELNDCSRVTLNYSMVKYFDYWKTNLAIVNTPLEISDKLRNHLCGIGDLFPFESSRCSNHLGVSSLVTTSDNQLLIALSTSKITSSPTSWVPPVSGSADFKSEYLFNNSLKVESDILREAFEEISTEVNDLYYDCPPIVLALCRNVLRGGKPELLFHTFVDKTFDDIRGKYCDFEIEKIHSLPAIIDKNGKYLLEENGDIVMSSYYEYISMPVKDGITITPILKALLHYYLSYCQNVLDREERP